MVLVGLALLWHMKEIKSDFDYNENEFTRNASSSISRVILPMIDELGNLEII